MRSCRGSSELIFVVLNFVTPEARYANDVNNRLKIRGWKNSWVENFVTRGIVTKITKISTPPKITRYTVLTGSGHTAPSITRSHPHHHTLSPSHLVPFTPYTITLSSHLVPHPTTSHPPHHLSLSHTLPLHSHQYTLSL